MKRFAFVWGSLLCGCSSSVDVGAHDAGVMGQPGPTNESCENGTQSPIVGTWVGYVENRKWASGSDAIHLVISNANDTLACGSVSLGDAPPPPPATDPTVGYPPGEFEPAHTPTGGDISTFVNYTEGFVMPMAQPKVTGSRLQFQAKWTATWDTWCALQTPVASFGEYACLDWGSTDANGCHARDQSPVDCGRFMLCVGGLCACTAQECHPWNANCDTLDFDMQIAGDVASGSVALGCGGVHNVHFSRAL